MLRRYLSIASIVFLVFSMTLGVLVLNSDIASAETWTDDFSDDDFDARWIKGGIGRTDIVDEYAWALSFDQYPENPGFPIADEDLPLWYGPTLRANISTASDFDITVVFDCVADITDYNVGRLEVKLLDSSGKSVYTFGWADTSNDTNEVSLNLRGWNGASIFTTGENYDYTVFADKPMTLQRTGDQLVFLVDGAEKFSGQTDIKGINAVELVFLKLKEVDILMCTPTTMQFGSISIQTTDASVPSKPLDIECLGDDSFINLNWTEPADDGGLPVTGYKIYRGETSGSLEFLTSVGQVYGFNDTGLTNGITYYYQVSAVNDAGDSSLSDEASGIPITFPGAPRNLQGLTDSNGVQLSWEAPNSDGGADITQYKVFRGIQSDSLTELAVLGNVLEYQDISITNGSTYYYSVSAVNSQGESPMTSPIEVITGAAATAPSAPREL
ncbi:MAG: fibronectin type III domain-containing protein, partial [Thermoplasmata archaeon]|nr:fibronectin type III domain-containing protein [Thermoplasmata archaeon]